MKDFSDGTRCLLHRNPTYASEELEVCLRLKLSHQRIGTLDARPSGYVQNYRIPFRNPLHKPLLLLNLVDLRFSIWIFFFILLESPFLNFKCPSFVSNQVTGPSFNNNKNRFILDFLDHALLVTIPSQEVWDNNVMVLDQYQCFQCKSA